MVRFGLGSLFVGVVVGGSEWVRSCFVHWLNWLFLGDQFDLVYFLFWSLICILVCYDMVKIFFGSVFWSVRWILIVFFVVLVLGY